MDVEQEMQVSTVDEDSDTYGPMHNGSQETVDTAALLSKHNRQAVSFSSKTVLDTTKQNHPFIPDPMLTIMDVSDENSNLVQEFSDM